MKPFCYFFDIDGTIIGDISMQVYEWDIVSKYDASKMQQFKKNVCGQLSNGVLRPGLSTFLDFLKQRHVHEGCEFFIYTASDTKWANFIVSCIETVIGQKFNRPLFTRPQCIQQSDFSFSKSLNKIFPAVLKKLKQQYGVEISQNDLKSRFVLFDNNKVLGKAEESKLVLCPSYVYTDVSDILRLLPEEVMQKHFLAISSTLQSHGMFPTLDHGTLLSYQVFKAIYFSYLGKQVKDKIKNNQPKDAYWSDLGNLMYTLPVLLKDSNIKTINHSMRQ